MVRRLYQQPGRNLSIYQDLAKSMMWLAAVLILATTQFCLAENASKDPCPRFAPGSIVTEPPQLYSRNGVLAVSLSYSTSPDINGNPKFCFTTPDGKQSPTLHVHPGDHLIIRVKNNLPAPTDAESMRMAISGPNICGASMMDSSSMNIHYHGTNTSPRCGQDEVIRTLINSGQTFTYNVAFPKDEPRGLYWYHPHVHGLSEAAVQGGASGAIIVDGIESLQRGVIGLPQRVLLIRDQLTPCGDDCGDGAPAWDVSLNYIPVTFPKYQTAVVQMVPGGREFWRVGNVSADLILDLQLRYDGHAQPLEIVALDGVPVGSQDGTRRGKTFSKNHILIPPAGRVEFIVKGPSKGVQKAILLTRSVDTGPDGDLDPERPLATIQTTSNQLAVSRSTAPTSAPMAAWHQRFEGLMTARVTAQRKLYFSEDNSDGQFFITVDGDIPTLFDPNNPPAITTTQGSVEEWTIENRALENHEFHMHQIHFMLLARNGKPVAANERQFVDMVDLPYWTGTGPYPSVTVRMDFRGPDIGDFVYHCHILEHEDKGMMATIRVLPSSDHGNSQAAKEESLSIAKVPNRNSIRTKPSTMQPSSQQSLVDSSNIMGNLTGLH